MVRLLTALVWAATPTPTEEPRIDWAAVRKNTAAYEAELLARESRAAVAGLDEALSKRLGAAQHQLGEGPSGARRLVPHAIPETQEALASVELEEAMALLLRKRAQVEQTFADAEAQLGRLPDNSALKERLAGQRSLFDARMTELSRRLSDIGAGLNGQSAGSSRSPRAESRGLLDTAGDGLLRFGRQLAGRDEPSALAELRGLVQSWSPAPRPILGASTLNYVHGELAPQPLSTASITPAYALGGSAGLTLEDTTTGREVEVSAVVRAKADTLAGPLEAYDFVKNELALDWYLGALKGSTETLREGRGNDADLSALLIALLRAKQIPARFVRGTIELPTEKLADLMGLLTGTEVDQLYARGAAPTPFVLDAGRRA
ncbi:MAG: transglutaminase domain-containing protein, partial [Archangium sp.]|nr:transglutaminase domain-containing protein [Archangium sp.]